MRKSVGPWRHAIGTVVGAALTMAVTAGAAAAASFVVTDADFVGGVYDFHFYNEATSRTVINGVNQGIGNPTLTNNGWVCCRDDGPRFWHAQGQPFGFAELTAGNLTMGWDFSAVTGQIAKVELNPRHFLFQFNEWNEEAVGDQIAGFVSTPGSFGTGAYTELYRFTGEAGNNTTVGAGALTDYSGFIAGSWLDDPALLEFKFDYQQTPGQTGLGFDQGFTIPAAHLQLFRDFNGIGDSGFVLRVTLDTEPSVDPIPAPVALPLLILGLAGISLTRRKPRG
jgi:hypothetical protein